MSNGAMMASKTKNDIYENHGLEARRSVDYFGRCPWMIAAESDG
jgi:hypothetical protein